MDWMPLLVGAAAGIGNAAQAKYLPNSASGLGKHKGLIYRLGLVGAGAYGAYSGKLSADLSYGLMVSGATLLGTSVPAAINGGGLGAFGDVAYETQGTGIRGYHPVRIVGPIDQSSRLGYAGSLEPAV